MPFVFIFLFCFFSLPAFSQTKDIPGSFLTLRSSQGVCGSISSLTPAGTSYSPHNIGPFLGVPLESSKVVGSCPPNVSREAGKFVNSAGYSQGFVFEIWYCPNGVPKSGNLCTVPSNPCSDTQGKPLVGELSAAVSGSGVIPQQVCQGSCAYDKGSRPVTGIHAKSGGSWTFVTWDSASSYVGIGSTCSGQVSGSDPSDDYLQHIKNGECPGNVNGVDVWVKCDSVSADGKKSTSQTTNPDGTTKSTDVSSKTTCEGDKCTTTKTETNSDGTQTTDTQTQDKKSFCDENPGFISCKDSSFSDSTCTAMPVCEGDAIQCAIAKKQHESLCAFKSNFETKEGSQALAVGNAALTGGLHPDGHPFNDKESVSINFAGSFNAGGGGGCPSDVQVMGVTVPLSRTCEGLNALGIAALGISLIWAARIVFGG